MKYKKKGKPSIHILLNPPIKEPRKRGTGEFPLFIRIAEQRSYNGVVSAKHIDTEGNICSKMIRLEDLTPTNFSHVKNKGMHKELRLEPSNIEIVSTAWHFYEHNKQVLKVDYPN